MFIRKKDSKGRLISIIVRAHTTDRLEGTCFRGTGNRLAGNFSLWNSPHEMFSHESVIRPFIKSVADVFDKGEFGCSSVEIPFPLNVGWSSTDRIEKYKEEELEEFKPNNKSFALRVKSSAGRISPRTRYVTFIFEAKMEESSQMVIVHSIYPGKDIGDLIGDITNREKCVFFDWSNQGE
jgi:hypothetical protein